MIVYHGTTSRRARRICAEGFLPKKPSRRVWFAQSKAYALGRARTQARRSHDSAVVLTCDLDLDQMRNHVGARKVFCRGGVIAIDARVPVSALRSYPGWVEQPSSPEDLASWVNEVLRLRRHKGVGSRHPGIGRLSRWVVNRLTSRPNSTIRPRELLGMARQWLPEFFEDVEIDPETLQARRRVSTIQVQVEAPEEESDPREVEALECLESEKPERRVRGLGLLADVEDPDLFDWCAMFLEDDSPEVTAGALHTMLSCEEADPEVIAPYAESEDKRVRAAATAALAKHGGADARTWLERGLKDPETCVRFAVAAVLPEVDPVEYREIFELALYDPNPEIRRRARTLTEGKGFEREGARWGAPRA
jgi:hypothetical protein